MFGVVLAFAGVDFNVVSDNEIKDNFIGIEIAINTNNNTVEDNEISNGSSHGIIVVISSNFNKIIDNAILNSNIFDLLWDLTGIGNCWEGNEFTTSSPTILPSC